MRFLSHTPLAPLKPTVPRRLGQVLVGLLWAAAGSMLLWRAASWEGELRPGLALALALMALALALPTWKYGFRSIVRRNMARLSRLPDRICAFAIQPVRGWLMVAVMVPLGLALRHSSIPHGWLVVPYGVMGALLLAGSLQLLISPPPVPDGGGGET